MVAGEQDVVGFDVAMHHALRMRVHERLGGINCHAQRVSHRHRASRSEPVAHGLAGGHRHHVVQQGSAIGLARIE